MRRVAKGYDMPVQDRRIEPGVNEVEVRRVGFTGTREPTRIHAERARQAVESLPVHTVVFTGGCVGVDALVARAAKARGLYVHVILPSDHSRVDPEWRRYCDSYEQMPPGTSYKDRDARLVHRSRELIAIPLVAEHAPASRRSGTWMTVRLARRDLKPVRVVGVF